MALKSLSFFLRYSCILSVFACVLSSCNSIYSIDVPTVSPVAPAEFQSIISPNDGTKNFDPSAPVAVSTFHGTIQSVTMKDQFGKHIPGKISDTGKIWQPMITLDYDTRYTIVATSIPENGSNGSNDTSAPVITRSVFTTALPSNKTRVYFRSTGNIDLSDQGTYGIGLVIVAHFDENITNHAIAEKYLSVTTNPPVIGSWYWATPRDAHWRPEKYYASGTTITATAHIYGQQIDPGLFGENNTSITVKIGPSHFLLANDKTHQISVFENDRLIKKMPTSMGQGGYIKGKKGLKISLWTPSGIYTVISRGNPVMMDSSSFGLPVNSSWGYKLKINYATKISNDGIYLHELESTVWAQGHQNTSHGCLNLNHENASWFYKWALDGDPVQVINTGGPKLTLKQNGDWSIPWSEWLKGSALIS